ncbi:MAG TPA: hypothetical protein VLG38_07585, partial [Gammaproteobacteria bacterium]|nr:hypothetical protein [Gammaproteobacteria bacterium]
YNVAYMHFYVSKTIDYWTALLGFERLGGSSSGSPNKMFITPLGSVDNFNGMAQAFTTTPPRGLQDAYATLSAVWRMLTGGTTYHVFLLDKGPGAKFAGQELDIYVNAQLTKQIDLNITYATYGAKNNAAISVNRFWIMLYAHLL